MNKKEVLKALVFIFIGIVVAFGIYTYTDMGNNKDNEDADKIATSTPAIATSSPAWSTQIPEIQKVLGAQFNEVKVAESEPISIYKKTDITGDGNEEALVSLGSGGAYAEYFALMQFKNGKPALARFKLQDGTIGNVLFLEGASVSHGTSVELAPSRTAIYSESWDIDTNTDTILCEIEAYKWNKTSGLFEYDIALGKSVTDAYCKKIVPVGHN